MRSGDSVDAALDQLRVLKELRHEARDAYHRSVERGRHPRSFPHHCGVFAYVEASEKRLRKVRSGATLSGLVHMLPMADPLAQDDTGLSTSTTKFNGLLDLDESVENAMDKTTMRGESELDCIAVAEDYIREYRPGAVRRQIQSKRLSSFRNKAAKDTTIELPASLAPGSLGTLQKLSKMSQRHIKRELGMGAAIKQKRGLLNNHSCIYQVNESHEQKVLYGCKIALEICENYFFTVSEPSGEMDIKRQLLKRPPQNAKNQPTTLTVTEKEIAVFTVFKLNDLESEAPIQDGDEVWLAISSGPGNRSWKHGSVIGSKTSVINVMNTLKVDRSRAGPEDVDEQLGHVQGYIIGQPEAVTANVPDFEASDHEKKSSLADLHRELASAAKLRRRNQRAVHTGRWKIKIIDPGKGTRSKYVLNGMQVYFEQNMGFLSCTSTPVRSKSADGLQLRNPELADTSAVIRALSTEAGVVPVDKRGIWTLHFIEDQRAKEEPKSSNQENALHEATRQLNQSERFRNGSTVYAHNLHSGEDFPRQIRSVRKHLEVKREDKALHSLERLQPKIGHYFASKFSQLAPIESTTSLRTRLSHAQTLTSQQLKSWLVDTPNEEADSAANADTLAANAKDEEPAKEWMYILGKLKQEDAKLRQQISTGVTVDSVLESTARTEQLIPELRCQDRRIRSYLKHTQSVELGQAKSQVTT